MDPESYQALKESIRADGLQTPVVLELRNSRRASKTYTVYSGYYRVRALQELGAAEVWAIVCINRAEAEISWLWENYRQ